MWRLLLAEETGARMAAQGVLFSSLAFIVVEFGRVNNFFQYPLPLPQGESSIDELCATI